MNKQDINKRIKEIKKKMYSDEYIISNEEFEKLKIELDNLKEIKKNIVNENITEKAAQEEDNYEKIAEELISYSDNDTIKSDSIDECVLITNEYKANEDNEEDSEKIFNIVYDKISNALEKRGYTCRYVNNKYVYDRYEKVKEAYNEIIDYLENSKYDFVISHSTNPGELPSIYVKNKKIGETFRIANHYNGRNNEYNQIFNQIYENSDYINWKDTILKDMIKKLEY